MSRFCAYAQERDYRVFLYGSTPETLKTLQAQLLQRFPRLQIVGAMSPPFRKLTKEEERQHCREIEQSMADVVWVGLGCPRQEAWMARNRHRLSAVLVGVGAAFDFHAGVTPQAPPWMQRSGLEWLFRLASEPRRLWKRYLTTNSVFLVTIGAQLIGTRVRTFLGCVHRRKVAKQEAA